MISHRLCLLWAISSPAFAATLYVDTTDSSAFQTIQSAVNASGSGDTIEIADGTYAECIDTLGRSVSFRGTGLETTIIDASGLCSNALSVYYGETVSVMDLTIRNAIGRGVYHYYSDLTLDTVRIDKSGASDIAGGAMYVDGGTTRLLSAVLEDNEASHGGAIYLNPYSNLQITDSTIQNNYAAYEGGAIYDYWDSATTIDSTTFSANESGTSGGAIYAYAYSDYAISGSIFNDHLAGGEGGALSLYWPIIVEIEDSEFTGNTAADGYVGGAIQMYVATTVEMTRNLFCGNAASYGGAVSDQWTSTTDVWTNNLFIENQATIGGGVYRYAVYLGEFVNNTFAGNEGSTWGGGYSASYAYADFRNNAVVYTTNGNGIYAEDTNSLANTPIEYSGWWENTVINAGGYFYVSDGKDGNLVADPGFVSWSADGDCSNDDLRLAAGSAFRDAGDPEVLDPDGSVSDIGAYGGPNTADDWYIAEPGDTGDTGEVIDTGHPDDTGGQGYPGADSGDRDSGWRFVDTGDGEFSQGENDGMKACSCANAPRPTTGLLGLWLGLMIWMGRRSED